MDDMWVTTLLRARMHGAGTGSQVSREAPLQSFLEEAEEFLNIICNKLSLALSPYILFLA